MGRVFTLDLSWSTAQSLCQSKDWVHLVTPRIHLYMVSLPIHTLTHI